MENEQADTRRDGQICITKPNSQARTGTRDFFPVQLAMDRIGNLTRLICTQLEFDDHTCIHIYCRVYPQLPPVIGAPRVCCGHASGISFSRLLCFGGCSTHVTPCSVPGYSYFTICSEKSEHNCLTSYWYTAAILASFVFIRVFKEVLWSEVVE